MPFNCCYLNPTSKTCILSLPQVSLSCFSCHAQDKERIALTYADFVKSRAKPLPTREERLEHAYMGILGELGEIIDAWKKHQIYEQSLDLVNIKEELGDLRFYIQMVINEIDNYEPANEGTGRVFKSVLVCCLGTAADVWQMLDIFGGDENGAQWLERNFWWLCDHFGFEPQDVIVENMAKLMKRYPNGYSNEHAKARLDKVSE